MPVVDAEGHLVNNLAFDEQLGRLDEPTLDAIRGEILRDLCDTNPQLRNRLAENTDTSSAVTIGSLSATDPDASDTASFSLVAGTGSTDNAKFQINIG